MPTAFGINASFVAPKQKTGRASTNITSAPDATWNRMVTRYDRDADIIEAGIGMRF